MTILHIDSSARREGSVTRALTAEVAERLGGRVIRRDLATPLPQIDEAWVTANFTPADARNPAQRQTLALSDDLVAELKDADTIIIGVPLYNFGIPASLKAWIDLVARAGVTFRYTDAGPQGLLEGKRVVLVLASGGVPIGSEADFASGHLRQVLSFLGLTDVEIIAADRTAIDSEAAVATAQAQVAALAA